MEMKYKLFCCFYGIIVSLIVCISTGTCDRSSGCWESKWTTTPGHSTLTRWRCLSTT